ncbi:excinuclease ABC, C subunit [Pseudothermotoga thermarum DSM 5069]|uniref:UvrABC system protein C n=1 Tax=Pseudothermotoga thermarum DSM 5069 TaxID=688269 RepID=F7YY27_9THEM|nr:excinuclease ABC, C subunit [Pseudothermotoga thermarum DSM 5069]
MSIEEKAKQAPNLPGVYIFYGPNGEYLYIGKAKNLRKRLKSYFSNSSKTNRKMQQLLQEAIDLDFTIVENEREALLLEANLIYTYKPKYNVMLKDSQHYPYIEITNDLFPTIRITRNKIANSEYFGPYTDANFVRDLVDFLQQVYKFRTCEKDLSKPIRKPCMDYYLHRCEAPCVGNITHQEYFEKCILPTKNFLKGDILSTLELIKRKMKIHADMLDFENAAKYRDLLFKFEKVMQKQQVVVEPWRNLDVIGQCKNVFVVFRVRGGYLVGKLSYEMEGDLKDFLFNYYIVNRNEIPPAVVSKKAVNVENLVVSRKPMDEVESGLLKKAMINAQESLQHIQTNLEYLRKMQEILNLSKIPIRIEGIDVSHLHGELTVASVVVFVEGNAQKDEYRHYRFDTQSMDDLAVIRQLVLRRYSKHSLPDLIFVDGGQEQVKTVKEALKSIGKDCDVVGLAKKEEIIHTINGPVRLPLDNPVLRILVKIRDEAHRFANSFHAKLRLKKLQQTVFDQIKGIGSKRKEKLLAHFGSVQKIKEASVEEIAKVIKNKKLAEEILKKLKGESS